MPETKMTNPKDTAAVDAAMLEARATAWDEYSQPSRSIEHLGVFNAGFDSGYAAAKAETCEWTFVRRGDPHWRSACDGAHFEQKQFCGTCGKRVSEVK